jgi:acyl-CoA thioester hydrolase
MARPSPPLRSAYPVFTRLATRWDDNDIYGHLNNTVHYKLFDTAVNGWLLDAGLLDPLAWKHNLSGCRDRLQLFFRA